MQDLLEAADGLTPAGEAVDGREAVDLALSVRPDVILMDVSMPSMSGLEATRILAAE